MNETFISAGVKTNMILTNEIHYGEDKAKYIKLSNIDGEATQVT